MSYITVYEVAYIVNLDIEGSVWSNIVVFVVWKYLSIQNV